MRERVRQIRCPENLSAQSFGNRPPRTLPGLGHDNGLLKLRKGRQKSIFSGNAFAQAGCLCSDLCLGKGPILGKNAQTRSTNSVPRESFSAIIEYSPAFQRWVRNNAIFQVPKGTAENFFRP